MGGAFKEVYSTNEQVIGEWIDGKPVYQITYEPASKLHTDGNVWFDTGMVISNIENIIDWKVVAKDTYVNTIANLKGCSFRYYNNNIQINVNSGWYLDILAITVCYTKTTDTAPQS